MKSSKMTVSMRNTIKWEQGWELINEAITKLKNGLPNPQFTSQDYMMYYTNPPHEYSQQLYAKYRETVEEYITSTVLPALTEKHGEFLLWELVERWAEHKLMVKWLDRIFNSLDRSSFRNKSLPTLCEARTACYYKLVYQELIGKVKDAVIALIDQEREGEQIDRALLKNVLDIFMEISVEQMDCYENDFESYMLKDTSAYYSRKASKWILEDSCPHYMWKVEECLKGEKDRASYCLLSRSVPRLLEKVQHELLSVYATQLLEKDHSGCEALLRDDKVDDLSRIYILYSKLPGGLEPVANIFMQHVTAEVSALVKQAEDAATDKPEKSYVVLQEQVFEREIIELHDKYLGYVNECFMNHCLFHKALKEAFQVSNSQGVFLF